MGSFEKTVYPPLSPDIRTQTIVEWKLNSFAKCVVGLLFQCFSYQRKCQRFLLLDKMFDFHMEIKTTCCSK